MVFQFQLDPSGNVAGYGVPKKPTPKNVTYANQARGGLNVRPNEDPVTQYLKLHGGVYPTFPQKPAVAPVTIPPKPSVPLIKPTPSVISNKDKEQQFTEDTKEIEQREPITPEKPTEEPITEPIIEKPTEKKEAVSTAAQDALDAFNAQTQKQKEDADAKIAKEQEEYRTYYQTSLANINSTTAQIVTNIQAVFSKRIAQTQRLNQLEADSMKAHGIAGGAQFFSEAFKGAIMQREREDDAEVSALEGERNDLIAQAKNARDEGEAGLLRQKITDLKKVENDINTQLNATYNRSLEQYKLQLAAIKEKEQEQKKLVEAETKKTKERLVGMAIEWADDYEKAKDKNKFIKDLEAKGWGSAVDIFLAVQKAIRDKRDEETKAAKAKQDLASAKSLESQRRAGTLKTLADIETAKETAKLRKAQTKKTIAETEEITLEDIEGEEEIKDAEDAEIGEVVEIDGKKYKKVGEDDYEPL